MTTAKKKQAPERHRSIAGFWKYFCECHPETIGQANEIEREIMRDCFYAGAASMFNMTAMAEIDGRLSDSEQRAFVEQRFKTLREEIGEYALNAMTRGALPRQ